jgi:hypothetical protein
MSCHLWLARRLTLAKIVTRSINESCPPARVRQNLLTETLGAALN